jgi:hypothetical protein
VLITCKKSAGFEIINISFLRCLQMPINKSDIIFIGNAGGICGYMSHSINIIRKSTSLTGKRIEKDPAFTGFRKSCNRMKEASPIAASLYKLMPKEEKVYSLYRTLTGEALKMIKEGLEKDIIIAKLKEQYINPAIERLKQGEETQKHQTISEQLNITGNLLLFSKNLFKVHPYSQGNKRHLRLKPHPQYANNSTNQTNHTEEHYSYKCICPIHLPVSITSQQKELARKQKRISQFAGLTYLGKLKECKGFKMWLRPLIYSF